jgi:hypothetical protein
MIYQEVRCFFSLSRVLKHFSWRTARGIFVMEVPEVLPQKDANWNGVRKPFVPGISIT